MIGNTHNETKKYLVTTAELPPFLPDGNFVTKKQICYAEHISNYEQKQDTGKEKKENSAMDNMGVYTNLKKYKARRKNHNKKKIKCHFCKLEYITNRDRTEHELVWHANKSKRSGTLAAFQHDIKNGNVNSITNAY